MTKYCPLISGPFINPEGYEDVNRQECMEENCAWWCVNEKSCALVVIAFGPMSIKEGK